MQFLVHATRWPHDAQAIARIREAACGLHDADFLIALARRHHVSGLAARALSHCDGLVAAALRPAMRGEALALAEEQFRQLVQTRAAVEVLGQAGIAVAVLKGVPAALTLYGEGGVRRSVDIDLLVHAGDVAQAAQALEAIAYVRSDPPRDAPDRHLRIHARYGKDWGFDHCHSDTGIELHWRLFQNPRLLAHVSVEDAVMREVTPGIILPMLPERLGLLYAVAHGAEHGWSRLKWLADVATALRRDPGRADDLILDARDHGILHLTMAALRLSAEIYGTALPSLRNRPAFDAWRTNMLLGTARACLLGTPHATATRKNLSHYLFSVDPRHWWHELTYDMFHDAGGHSASRIGRRAARVLRLPVPKPLARA